MSIVRRLLQDRIARGASPSRFRGVDEREVEQLEARLGTRFPEVYREYLMLMGEEPGGVGQSVDIRFGCLFDITQEMRAAAAAIRCSLGGEAVAVYADQGVSYLYFRADEARRDPDPPLHLFTVETGAPKSGCPSVSNYLERLLAGEIIL